MVEETNLYSVNPGSGQATPVGPVGLEVTGLAARGKVLYGLGEDVSGKLVTIDTATGAATSVGPLVNVGLGRSGLAFDAQGTLWGIVKGYPSTLFTVDTDTGLATVVATTTGVNGIESLAIRVPRFHVHLPLVMR
jgi:hypothetical protein